MSQRAHPNLPSIWTHLLLRLYFGFSPSRRSVRIEVGSRLLRRALTLTFEDDGYVSFVCEDIRFIDITQLTQGKLITPGHETTLLSQGYIEGARGVIALDKWLDTGTLDLWHLYLRRENM